jgi:signal transduction histidine kinase
MDNLNFSVKTGLKDVIGKDLITDDNIAIFELVKNSYDAHANNVVITFEKSKIIIADDGKGMAYRDLSTKWLAVAYSAKNDGTEDVEEKSNTAKRKSYRDRINERKYYAGAKGIGRFSCDRLGSKLILTTQKLGKPIEQLIINWDNFAKSQTGDFEKVKMQHRRYDSYYLKFPKNASHGTILEIENAVDWDREKIKRLKHSLEKLINPFSETTDFNIEIISERDKGMDDIGINEKGKKILERDKINGKVSNSILSILKLKTTQIDVKIENDVVETKLIDRGTLIYHIREKNKFKLYINNLTINLYYLNRSAKSNFTRLMGVEPIKYGSIFLFKNGFRVQPYGNTGDDSWGLDFRAQQGYNRFLASRDLFGRVSIITDNAPQFKEVSSRDGGLVKTYGYEQLMDVFTVKGHRRLERYVVGVLWGEAFIKNNYFKSDDKALRTREELIGKDKDSKDISVAKSNIGSKIDFIRLIRNLLDEKDVEIINFDRDMVNIVNENLEDVQPKFIKDLEKIMEVTDDTNLRKTISRTEKIFRKLQQEKEDAEERVRKAEKGRLNAERIAKEEAGKRKKTEEEKKKVDAELERERKLGIFQRSIIGREKEQIMGLQHQILHSSGRIRKNVLDLLRYIDGIQVDDKIRKYVSVILLESAKVESLSKFITNANFDLTASEIKTDIVQFITDYIKTIYLSDDPILDSSLKIKIENPLNVDRCIDVRPLEITNFIDNFIQNSEKAKSKEILFSFKKQPNNKLLITISDDGKGILSENIDKIFDFGYTTTSGSGIGLYNVKSIVQKMKGKIKVSSEENYGTIFEVEL